jgi:hypothetical protein
MFLCLECAYRQCFADEPQVGQACFGCAWYLQAVGNDRLRNMDCTGEGKMFCSGFMFLDPMPERHTLILKVKCGYTKY